MTIDQAIQLLTVIRKQTKFGGDSTIAVCFVDSGIEYSDQINIRYESDRDGELVVIDVEPMYPLKKSSEIT